MPRISLTLGEQELAILVALAEREHRDTRAQASLLIRDELIRLGLLLKEQISDTSYRSKPATNEPVN